MHNSIIKISCLTITALCLLWGTVGCGGDEEPAQVKPEVVATRIKVAAPKPAKAEKPAAKAKKGASGSVAVAKPAAAESPDSGKTAAAKESDEASIQKTIDDIKKEAASGADSIYRARFYNPEGKIDPFKAPFKEETQQAPVGEEQSEEEMPDRIRQTPLEKIDLGQLKLVGVIRFPSGYKAIVEEQTGKGYTVKEGTYIGTNYGRITEIQKDRIIIQEKVRNVLGKVKDHERQLKLQKPLGEN
jgi:type IV pilus assembly protein PilP